MGKYEQLEMELEKRLIFLNKERTIDKGQLNDPVKHHHAAGSLERLEGTFGEIPFIEKLLSIIGENNA